MIFASDIYLELFGFNWIGMMIDMWFMGVNGVCSMIGISLAHMGS